MVKGISRQVIVVQSPEPKMFEQAIFILKDEAIGALDFASKIVCQQGCFSPLLETQSQGMRLACRLGQCFKMLCILRSPPETRTPLDTRIFSSKMVPKL